MLQRRHGKRRRAAGGDRDHNVERREPHSIDLPGGIGDVVFGAFDACGKCALPTGDDETQPLLGPGESRRQLRSVLYGDPARGTRANVDQAPAIAERFVCRVCRRGDGGSARPTAATAASWPSHIASIADANDQASRSAKRGSTSSVAMRAIRSSSRI